MAEAFLRKYGSEHFEAHSAGLQPRGINPLTIKAMDEIGINVSTQTSKDIKTYLGKTLFQHLITVCDNAEKNCPTIWPGINHRQYWSFEDPAAFDGTEDEKLEKFRQVRDQIEQKIKEWIGNIE